MSTIRRLVLEEYEYNEGDVIDMEFGESTEDNVLEIINELGLECDPKVLWVQVEE